MSDGATRIAFDWPPAALSPNARLGHWSQRAQPTKALREQAYWQTKAANIAPLPAEGEVMMALTFHPPDRRRRDLDSMLTMSKALLDGFADAVEVNDYRFAFTIRRAEPVKGGLVVVEIVG